MLRFVGSAFLLAVVIIAVAFCAPPGPLRPGSAPQAQPGAAGAGGQTGSGAAAGANPAANAGAQRAAPEPAPPTKRPGEVALEFDEATITRMANEGAAGMALPAGPLGSAEVKNLAVQLRGGRISASGIAQLGPTPINMSLGGTVQAQNGKPRIALDDARLGGVQMPQSARQSVEGTLQAQLDQLVAGQRVQVSSVTAGNGRLTIIGSAV